jgi:hypothetical protein
MARNLQQELCHLGGTSILAEALVRLNLVPRSSAFEGLVERGDWQRRGAETYAIEFDVVSQGTMREVILKAYVGFPTGLSVTDYVEEMVRRRELLRGAGVSSPTLYYWGDGVWVEQRLGRNLDVVLRDKSIAEVTAQRYRVGVFVTALALDQCEFEPIGPFDDLLTEAGDVFMVDFGQDLGPPGVASSRSANVDAAFAWLARHDPHGSSDHHADALRRARDIAAARVSRPT